MHQRSTTQGPAKGSGGKGGGIEVLDRIQCRTGSCLSMIRPSKPQSYPVWAHVSRHFSLTPRSLSHRQFIQQVPRVIISRDPCFWREKSVVLQMREEGGLGPLGGDRMRRWAPALAGSALIVAAVLIGSLEGPRHRVSLMLSQLDGVGAAADASTETMLTYRVQVPEGVAPGEVFLASIPGRGDVDVKAPNVAAGEARDTRWIQTKDATTSTFSPRMP